MSSSGSENLYSKFQVGQDSADLFAKFEVRQSYDFSNSHGIAFFWWGSGADINVNLTLKTPTGDLKASFSDGPAHWRWIFLRWSDFIEIRIDGSLPDKSRIRAILWTVHTPGVRRVDRITTWRCADLYVKFMIRRTTTVNLFAKLNVRQVGTPQNLFCKFHVGQDSQDLFCKFHVGQDAQNLFAKLYVRQTPEDLSTFTEVDGAVDKTATRVTVTNFQRSGQTSKLYKDYGAGYFTDFTHELEHRITANTIYSWWILWGLANNIENADSISGREYLLRAGAIDDAGVTVLELKEFNDGSSVQSDRSVNLNKDQTYYLTIIKSGTSLQCRIYDAPAKGPGDLVDTLTLTVTDAATQYFYATQTYGTGVAARTVSGWAQYYVFT